MAAGEIGSDSSSSSSSQLDSTSLTTTSGISSSSSAPMVSRDLASTSSSGKSSHAVGAFATSPESSSSSLSSSCSPTPLGFSGDSTTMTSTSFPDAKSSSSSFPFSGGCKFVAHEKRGLRFYQVLTLPPSSSSTSELTGASSSSSSLPGGESGEGPSSSSSSSSSKKSNEGKRCLIEVFNLPDIHQALWSPCGRRLAVVVSSSSSQDTPGAAGGGGGSHLGINASPTSSHTTTTWSLQVLQHPTWGISPSSSLAPIALATTPSSSDTTCSSLQGGGKAEVGKGLKAKQISQQGATASSGGSSPPPLSTFPADDVPKISLSEGELDIIDLHLPAGLLSSTDLSFSSSSSSSLKKTSSTPQIGSTSATATTPISSTETTTTAAPPSKNPGASGGANPLSASSNTPPGASPAKSSSSSSSCLLKYLQWSPLGTYLVAFFNFGEKRPLASVTGTATGAGGSHDTSKEGGGGGEEGSVAGNLNSHNVFVWEVNTRKIVASFHVRRLVGSQWPLLKWRDDELFCSVASRNSIQVSTPQNHALSPLHRDL